MMMMMMMMMMIMTVLSSLTDKRRERVILHCLASNGDCNPGDIIRIYWV